VEAAMQKLATWTLGLIGLAGSANSRRMATGGLTLKVEAVTARPATFVVWMDKPRHVVLGDSTRLGPIPFRDSMRTVPDSVVATTPASIPIDSATREIEIRVKANAPVRVRVLDGSRELQRPLNAWGREVKLRRVGDHFDVLFDMRPIQPHS
jgi:hypothetical protein